MPAVVARTRAEKRRDERQRQALGSAKGLVLAVLLHGAVGYWLWTMPVSLFGEPEDLRLEATLSDSLELPDYVEPEPREEVIEDPDELLDEPEVNLDTELVVPEQDDIEFGEDILGLGAGALGLGRGGGGGRRGALGVDGADLEGVAQVGSPFRDFVEDLRRRGLDLVFVVDATASMGKFIAQARVTIDDVIGDLAAVVPSLRLGLVAYRDETDTWVSRRAALSADRYLIHNFLLDLTAVGGGDFEEALDEGLRVAIEELDWRPGARRVIILVGDAPMHQEDETSTMALIRSFTGGRDSLVNVLYTGVDPTREATTRDKQTRKIMEKLARAGGGLMVELLADDARLRERITDATFGREWKQDIERLLATTGEDRRLRIVRSRVDQGDRAWLRRNLARDPIHPEVVEGCLALFDKEIANEALRLCLDESRPQPTRSVALYVLKRTVAPNVSIDVQQPLAAQDFEVTRLRRLVEGLRRKAAPVPPVPTGRGG